MAERVFDRMKHYRKAATRHDRLDETFLANLQLILIAIYLKKTQPKTQLVQTHANTNTSTPALRQSSGYDWQILTIPNRFPNRPMNQPPTQQTSRHPTHRSRRNTFWLPVAQGSLAQTSCTGWRATIRRST